MSENLSSCLLTLGISLHKGILIFFLGGERRQNLSQSEGGRIPVGVPASALAHRLLN